ncbi:MAG: transposase [Candidatus Brachytrichaceae bacterium NZ_4S206]|jgi:transposase
MVIRSNDLSDKEWERIRPLLPPQRHRVGRPAHDHRTIISGILWVERTGGPWRQMPRCYGAWSTVASRYYRWKKAGIWQRVKRVLDEMAEEAYLASLAERQILNQRPIWQTIRTQARSDTLEAMR